MNEDWLYDLHEQDARYRAAKWQTIETPPGEFAPVLVFVPSAWLGGIKEEPDMIHIALLKRGAYYLQDDDYSIVKPTHWAPLPPLPRT